MNKVKRKTEKDFLKKEIKRMMSEIGVSKRFFKRNMPRVTGEGYDFFRVPPGSKPQGKKPSLRQQYSLLKVLLESHINMKDMLETQKKNIEKDQDFKAHGSDVVGKTDKEELFAGIKSVFDK